MSRDHQLSGVGGASDATVADRPGPGVNARIEDYALIGDLETAALVSRSGSIDWLCFPRFDSPACFAALLGDEQNGHWSLAPRQPVMSSERSYRTDTLILETRYETATGTALVTDFMAPRDAVSEVIRMVRGLSGRVEFATQLRMRLDYGSVVPWVRKAEHGIVAVAGPDALYVRSDVELHGIDHVTRGEFDVVEGDVRCFVLTRTESHLPEPKLRDPLEALAATDRFWTDWIANCCYSGEFAAQVRRSLIILKALIYLPTGGIVAAATTSLPENLGGVRNWDYRYCWLRDSTFVLQALMESGFTDEAVAWRDWLLRAVGGDPSALQVLYAVDGVRRLAEYEVDWLPGFAGSTPVRIGNAAAEQFQLDIYGELINGLSAARAAELPGDDPSWSLEVVLCNYLEQIYHRPDQSLWEMRCEPEHFVHSKVLAWVAFDRMVAAASEYGLAGPVERWQQVRDELHAEICSRGVDSERGCFVQAYGSKHLDAALLQLPLVGFLPWDDPRIVATVRAVQQDLSGPDGWLRRYDTDGDQSRDGLSGDEGHFIVCTFWLVEALCGIGEVDEAEQLFRTVLGVANDVGLLAEEYDATARMQLGNVPQAYSHVGLINAARRLHEARAPHSKPLAPKDAARG